MSRPRGGSRGHVAGERGARGDRERGSASRGHVAGERGSVTVELALALPVLVLVLAVALAGARWALGAAQAQAAAAHGARAAVVEPDARARQVAATLAGADPSVVSITRDGDWVTVCVPVAPVSPVPGGVRCATAYDAP